MAGTRRSTRARTAQDYQLTRIFLWLLLLVGPAFIYTGLRGNYRDRPSLKWPATEGTVMQSEWQYHGGKHSYYDVNFTYSYLVDDKRHLGHQIQLWNPRFRGDGGPVKAFVRDYHRGAAVDVHYDPQQPGNAVLFPGADEDRNKIGIWCGSIIFILSVFVLFKVQPKLVKLTAQKKAEEAKAASTPKPEKVSGLPHAFVTYEPGCKRKLNCFSDKEELEEVIGNDDDEGLQEWTSDDRVIDSAGKEYRLVKNSGKKRYHIEPTGETWSCDQLLDLTVADARLLNQDEDAIRRRVGNATADKRMAVLMQCIDDLPAGPKWAIIGLIAFLVLFFVGVFIAAYKVAVWLGR
jgi:hypothetical protein